jgi:hypothetical protein
MSILNELTQKFFIVSLRRNFKHVRKMKGVSKNREIATIVRKNDVAGKAQMPKVLCKEEKFQP